MLQENQLWQSSFSKSVYVKILRIIPAAQIVEWCWSDEEGVYGQRRSSLNILKDSLVKENFKLKKQTPIDDDLLWE